MRRILLAACLAASLVPITAAPAAACSCAYATPEEQANNARVVFTGRVLKIEQAQPRLVVRFRVTKVYKGEADRRVQVVTPSDSAACGCSFREGSRYTVFGSRSREPVPTNLCSGTKKGRIDPAEYGLPPGHPPS